MVPISQRTFQYYNTPANMECSPHRRVSSLGLQELTLTNNVCHIHKFKRNYMYIIYNTITNTDFTRINKMNKTKYCVQI